MPKAELVGRNPYEVFPELRAAVARVMTTDTPEFLPPLLHRRGRDKWIWHYLFRLPTNEFASFMIDVSDELREGGGSLAAEAAGYLDRNRDCPGPVEPS